MKIVRAITTVIALLVMAVVLWKFFAEQAGGKLVDEANAASQEASKLTVEAAEVYKGLITDETINGLPGNRGQIRPRVDQAAGLFEKSAAQFQVTAAKLEEAGGKLVDKVLSDYWKTKAEAARKRGSQKEVLRKIVLLLADDTITDMESFKKKYEPLVAEANKSSEEADAAEAKAAKIQTDNKDKIKQSN